MAASTFPINLFSKTLVFADLIKYNVILSEFIPLQLVIGEGDGKGNTRG